VNRAYPKYRIYGKDGAMAVKPIMPIFRSAGASGCVVDREGKILLEFNPKKGEQFLWTEVSNIALSAEECGLIVRNLSMQLPVELIRSSPAMQMGASFVPGEDRPFEKVLKVEPKEHGSAEFSLEYVDPETGAHDGAGPGAPVTCALQAGECLIFEELVRSSIKHLLGWEMAWQINNDNSVDTIKRGD
jgi:hypothetical protein